MDNNSNNIKDIPSSILITSNSNNNNNDRHRIHQGHYNDTSGINHYPIDDDSQFDDGASFFFNNKDNLHTPTQYTSSNTNPYKIHNPEPLTNFELEKITKDVNESLNEHSDFAISLLIFLLGFFLVVPWFFGVLYTKSTSRTAVRLAWASITLGIVSLFMIIFIFCFVEEVELEEK
ncbi:hypothetical protein SAMD00019534_077130, partial [Acytostelium subglobosum LB1]|uniref:hypothetical protein n=1 Tax=Acytostelium subglobosum LB1 TaxID=1410327 RepID=UPI000644C0D1